MKLKHLKDIKLKCESKLNLLKILNAKTYFIQPQYYLTIYKALVNFFSNISFPYNFQADPRRLSSCPTSSTLNNCDKDVKKQDPILPKESSLPINSSRTDTKRQSLSQSNTTKSQTSYYQFKVYSLQDNTSFETNPSEFSVINALGYSIQQKDLNELIKGMKLNDKIVNFYIKLVCNSLNQKALAIDSLFINKILSSDLRGVQKPSNFKEIEFLDNLEEFIHSLNLSEPLFIIGDLNMNFNNNQNIKDFIDHNDMINFISKPTRICSKFYSKSNTVKQSSTIIDLILHNGNYITETDVMECPFSDHCFVLAKLLINKPKNELKKIDCRNLSTENILKIFSSIDQIDFKPILKIIQLLKLIEDKEIYKYYQNLFKSYNDQKLIDYLKDKTVSDLKNSKKFWEFYSSKITVKSDKSSVDPINSINDKGKILNDKLEISNAFNCFFTSISSSSNLPIDESVTFIQNQKVFSEISNQNFKFSFTNANEIDELLKTIPSTSAEGICGIPTKILKSSSTKFKTVIAYQFNFSILSCTLPNDWKTAVVTPLFKRK
ncbi:unnamed protein product, partial [Brachionus calyciflorus]